MLKPFKALTVYYTYYTLTAIVAGMFFAFGGIFLALVSSVLLAPVYPAETKYHKNNLTVYSVPQGLLAKCCRYEIIQPKLFLFEKAYLETEQNIDAGDAVFLLKGDTIYYKHHVSTYNYKTDSTTLKNTGATIKHLTFLAGKKSSIRQTLPYKIIVKATIKFYIP